MEMWNGGAAASIAPPRSTSGWAELARRSRNAVRNVGAGQQGGGRHTMDAPSYPLHVGDVAHLQRVPTAARTGWLAMRLAGSSRRRR